MNKEIKVITSNSNKEILSENIYNTKDAKKYYYIVWNELCYKFLSEKPTQLDYEKALSYKDYYVIDIYIWFDKNIIIYYYFDFDKKPHWFKDDIEVDAHLYIEGILSDYEYDCGCDIPVFPIKYYFETKKKPTFESYLNAYNEYIGDVEND